MPDQRAVPMIVITTQQDHVEAINSALRNAGHAVHCTWISDARDLADAFLQTNCELVLVFADNASLRSVIKLRDQVAPAVPVIAARRGVDEAAIAEAMREGARDMVSLEHTNRLQAVVARELRACRMERALNETLASATEYRQQLQAFVEGSADAIAQVQEGIIVGTNPAWLELFGYAEDNDVLSGAPLMDLFESESHMALKGALVACLQDKWTGHALRLSALGSDGSPMAISLLLDRIDVEGEPAVRLSVPAQQERDDEPMQRLENALHKDPTTGLYHRRYFLDRLEARLAEPIRGGVRGLAYITPDKFSEIVAELGPLGSEELLTQLAQQLIGFMQPTDLYGRLGGTMFAALLERGTPRDVEAWGENVVSRISGALFEVANKSISITVTVGIAIAREDTGSVDRLLTAAMQENNSGRGLGGNQVRLNETVDTDTRIHAYDQIWVKHIKSALMENRFRLIHQPIASLTGDDQGMYDILLRMVDAKGNEVLPKEFLPAAERNGLMKNVDRWVIGAAIVFCAKRALQRVFVRLSKDSINDESLLEWLGSQIDKARVKPAKLCFQVTEEDARQLLKQTRDLAETLQQAGFGFAVEHFGAGRDPTRILDHIPMNFLKIDGSLMQGLSTNQALQEKIRGYVEESRAKNVQTIAERVEDAQTMAVLWQVGVSFMQGYFVKEPDVVLQGTS